MPCHTEKGKHERIPFPADGLNFACNFPTDIHIFLTLLKQFWVSEKPSEQGRVAIALQPTYTAEGGSDRP